MNMDHLNFVVEARYYGYWIALVFAIICLLMFVYVKILDARKQKESLNAERKKIHNDTILTKELVRKLSGFFMLEENCRGYDPNTPIGEIAKHAFLHWREFEKYRFDCSKKAEEIERKNNTIARMYERGFALEEQIQKNKRKRCLMMADWCDESEQGFELLGNVEYDAKCRSHLYFVSNNRKKWHNRWLELAELFKD